MKHWRKKVSKHGLLTVFRHTWTVLAAFLVCLAVVFTLFRALTPLAKQYKEPIQQQLATWTGQKVSIHDIGTTWYWFTPVLSLNQLTIQDDQDHILHFNRVMVGIDLLGSLLHRRIQPGVMYVDHAHFNIQQQDDAWQIEGFHIPNIGQNTDKASDVPAFFGILMSQNKLILKHISADIYLCTGKHIVLKDLHIKADHHAQDYRMNAQAIIADKPDMHLSVIANFMMDGKAIDSLSGQIYGSINRIDLGCLQTYFPHLPMQIKQGTGSIEAWLDVMHGHLKRAQAQLNLHDISVIESQRGIPHVLPRVSANMAWKQLATGWRLTVNQFLFNMDSIDWPKNALMLEYNASTLDYHGYVKTVPLQSLLQTNFAWPEAMAFIPAFNPKGQLNDTELTWKNGHIQNVLTRFSQVSWRANGSVPGVTGLSGAMYWQPTEGHIEMDGDHTVLSMKQPLAPIKLDACSVSVNWQYLSQGLRLSIDRLVLSHPHVVLSAAGAWDDPFGSASNVRFQVDFSAKEAQFWLPYIPSKGLKPKLEEWLKKDIPRIAHASGRLRIVGPMADFPFEDKQQGLFSIQSHVSGVDILVNESWPVNANINADIHVQGRELTADIDHAQLADVTLHQVRIAVPNIGTGKEVFLLHGMVKAPGEQIQSYVLATPLRERFSRWKVVKTRDLLGLDLHLEVPLYPESDHVYAKGDLDFSHNHVTAELPDNVAEFSEVSGRLHFNEYGLTNGGLDGVLDGHPFAMRVQPLLAPQTGTEMRFEGEIEVGYLQYLVHHPMFSLMQGRAIVTGLWTVYPDNADIDKLYLNSSLVGMALRLPKPFGKSAADIIPLTVNVDFSPKQRMDFHVKYGQSLAGLFSLRQNSQQDWAVNGDFLIGEGNLSQMSDKGLHVRGDLPNLDVAAWQHVLAKWPRDNNAGSLLTKVSDVDLHLGNMIFSGSNYSNINLYAHQNSPQEWALNVQHKDVAGDLTYNWKKNILSAHIARLNMSALQPGSAQTWKLNVADIPNFDLTIDQCIYNGVELGNISAKAETKPGHWMLKNAQVQTPEYQLNMQGDWVEQDHLSASSLEAQLHISSLIKSFKRWQMTPAVDARYGKIAFTGKWPGAFYDMSFQKIAGDMSLVLRNGYISHLDRETEQKLGLGKLLSILSLQTIPRRLKLDFSDLVQQGYTFDLFKGNFKISRGIMTTKDSFIDGPVAFGRMTGDLDLVNKLYDLDLRIYPYITASLPMVVTLAGGGPIAGIATWAISSLASKGMQKISGYTYKISGPWLDPVVQQVSIDKTAH